MDRLAERIDARGAVALEHVRQRDLGVGQRDGAAVEQHGRPALRRRQPSPFLALAHDRGGHDIPPTEFVDEALAVRIEQQGAVGTRRLGNRVPLERRWPEAAVRVVLQRIQVAGLATRCQRDFGHLAGRPGGVRRERAEASGLREAAATRSEHDRPRGHREALAVALPERRAPARGDGIERHERRVVEGLDLLLRAHGGAQRGRDRMPGAIADLQEPLARGSAAAREPVAPVAIVREGNAEALEPLDRAGRLGRERSHEPRIRRLVRAVHDVLGVHRGRVVIAKSGLDTALRLGGVGRSEPELGSEQNARAGVGGRKRGSQPGNAGANHKHIAAPLRHGDRLMVTVGAGAPVTE